MWSLKDVFVYLAWRVKLGGAIVLHYGKSSVFWSLTCIKDWKWGWLGSTALILIFYFIFTNLVLNDWNTLSKAKCVGFRGSYEKKSNMIWTSNMNWYQPEIKTHCVFFPHYLTMSLLYLKVEQVLFHQVHHVAPLCFYGSPEKSNQTLTIEKAFGICSGHRMRCWDEIVQLVAICNTPLDAT